MTQLSRKLIIADIIFFLVAIFVVLEIVFNGFLVAVDVSVNALVPAIYNTQFIEFSKIINTIFDAIPMIVISFILCIVIWYKDCKKDALFFTSVIMINAILIFLIKNIVQRPRPLNALISLKDYGFPSGHVTNALVFFGILSYLLLKNPHIKKLKFFIIGIFIFMIALIGFTRIYLNVHWLSDVIGGLAIGGFILISCILLEQRKAN